MRQVAAIGLVVLSALLGLSGAGQAQPPSTVQVQGTIQAVDCRAHTLTLETPGGSAVYRAAASAAIVVNSAGVPFCALQQYPGAAANVWLTAIGNEIVITRIDAVTQAYQPSAPPAPAPPVPAPYTYPYPAYPYPAYPYGPYPYYYYPPLAGFVLGTILVGGLAYLLVRGAFGFYRYPYYGAYHRYYYSPAYRPYYGGYRFAPAYTWTGRGWSYGGHR